MTAGAEVRAGGGVEFRVWASRRTRVDVVLHGEQAVPLVRGNDGLFTCTVDGAGVGTRYQFRLDGAEKLYPDPRSRFQPDGPHGPSQVVDPRAFRWSDDAWRGITLQGQVIYEMHLGTFTREGTWIAARAELAALKETGITCLEIMPVAEFGGRFGWGYDGVDLYAPSHLYGSPDDMRAFVDEAHGLGLAVILDVVYNHLGPDGNYLREFSEAYFAAKQTEWGEAINFDGKDAAHVRRFFTDNAAYWIREFHLDGLRLDATQQIFDESPRHILIDVAEAARQAAGKRSVILVNENEPQHAKLVRPVERGGYGLDALWNDDLHHSAFVAVTGRHRAYYTDTPGRAQELVSAAKYGYLFQGQRYAWQKKARGTPAFDLKPEQFVAYLENHDQVANSGRGLRLHQLTSPGRLRAITAYILLAPATPMLFQGQEFCASAPFFYFADHDAELNRLVARGRLEFLEQFPELATDAMRAQIAPPAGRETFERCKLDFGERETNAPMLRFHRDLLRLRREDPVFHAQRPRAVDGSVFSDEAFVLRFFGDDAGDRLLLVNLGRDLPLTVAPEPLLAPPEGTRWERVFTSEAPEYGGTGTADFDAAAAWMLPGHAAIALRSQSVEP